MGRPAVDRTGEILSAARELIQQGGPRAMTIDQVAAAAHVGKGTVFLHWSSKQRLIEAVARLEVATMTAEVTRALRREPEHLSMAWIVTRLVQYAWQRPLVAAIITDGRSDLDDEWAGEKPPPPQAEAFAAIVAVLRAEKLLTDMPDESILETFGVMALGSIMRGIAAPPQQGSIVHAIQETIGRAVDSPGRRGPARVRRAAAQVITLFDAAIDAEVAASMPDRPTGVILRPRSD